MRRSRWVTGLVLGLAVIAVAAPAQALGATANGIGYAGSSKCLECHGRTTGRWQVGSYVNTLHSINVRTVAEIGGVDSIFPAPNTSAWPSPLFAGGTFRFAPADVAYQLGGHDSHTTRFISKYGNDKANTLSTGYTQPTTAGPKDDLVLFNGRYLSHEGYWNPGAIGPRLVLQNCGPCHFTGVNRPAAQSYTLPNGSKMAPDTPTSFSEYSIRCESCHAANGGDKHWNTGVPVSRTPTALSSQTCGQCHVKFTSKQRNATNGSWSSPNGFTPDQKLSDFGTVLGSQWVKKSLGDPEPSIPATDPTFFPTGHLKAGGHGDGLYNEWQLSAHSHSLRTQNGQLYIPFLQDECLPCHSGEGFLQSIGYGADGPNDIGLHRSSIASDTLNIECGVCHAVHPKSGTSTKLRLEADELCMKCHVQGTAEIRSGKGLLGVSDTGKWMPGAECYECHMPRTAGNRSHRLKIMMPGDAAKWEDQFDEPGDVDSCSPCHHGQTLEELQEEIDTWQEATEARVARAESAIAAAKKRRAASTTAGKTLLSAANKNVSLVKGDGSNGVHNYPYATAGLAKASVYAKGVGARFTAFGSTGYAGGGRTSLVFGTLKFGDGSGAKGETIAIEAAPAGTSRWAVVGSTTAGDGGSFAYAVKPVRSTSYRARWAPRPLAIVRSNVTTVRR
ncbi:MAG: ammonia-forming cytochrome c nitrite reductase subunit c552 [Coriobacteriia bacterium]|nr:ammonia-forming cytochrome c nitrite reductase subunit c552 [Coriobacteriia bacterium]